SIESSPSSRALPTARSSRRDWRRSSTSARPRSRTKDQEPRTKNQEPRTTNQAPGITPMHEYSIVQALFDQIGDMARGHGAIAVRRVRVRVGEIAGVDVELLRTAYDLFRVNTLC